MRRFLFLLSFNLLCLIAALVVYTARPVHTAVAVAAPAVQGGECETVTTGRPVDVMLVLDASSSMGRTGFDQARLSALDFVDALDFTTARVGIATFEDSAELVHALSADEAAVRAALSATEMGNSPWPTFVSSGLQVALTEMENNARPDSLPVIIVLSDGGDDYNQAVDVADEAKAVGAEIISVGLSGVREDLMQAIASLDEQGNPRYEFAPKAEDLRQIYTDIANTVSTLDCPPDLIQVAQPISPTTGTLVTMTITAEPLEVQVNEAVTVQIALSGDSSSCGQSIVARPVDVILVLDHSGSMAGEPLEQAKAASQAFVREMDFSADRVGVVQFSSGASLVHPLSTDESAVSQAINTITEGGGTAIDSGLDVAFIELNGNIRDEATPVIVLLSDGESNASSAQHAAQTAKAADMKVATVGLGPGVDENLLRSLATVDEDGNPLYFASPDGSDLEQIYINIARSIREFNLASNVVLRHELEAYDFFVVPESLNPSGQIQGETIVWELDVLESGTTTFSFQVRPRQPGTSIDIGRLTEAIFLECEQTQITIQLPPGPAIDILPGEEEFRPLPDPCAGRTFPWWLLAPLLLLLLLLLFLLTPWGRRLWRKLLKKPLLCKLLALLTLLYLLFLAALIARTLIGDPCPVDRIYFWRFNAEDGEVSIMESRFAGETAEPVTHLNMTASCTACHSGNSATQQLAAVQDDQNGPIVAATIAGDELITPPMNGSYFAWSPDGTQAALSFNDQDIYVLNVISNTLTALAGASEPNVIETMPTWSADGSIIAFVRAGGLGPNGSANLTGHADIYTVPAGGGTALPLVGASGEGFNYYPVYSPDGRWLAFTHHTTGEDTYANEAADIYMVPATGGQPVYLRANSEFADSWPSWSNDSRWLGFNSNRRGQFDAFAAEIGPGGQSSDVYYFPAAFDESDEEFHPVWLSVPETLWWERLLALWPWLLPLLLLLILGWFFCRERRYELTGTVIDAITREPIAGAEIKIRQPEWPEQQAITSGEGRYQGTVGDGLLALAVSAESYIPQARHTEVKGEAKEDFQLYRLADPAIGLRPPGPISPWEKQPVWQPDPTLVIGLGGTGRHVLTHLLKNLLDAGKGSPSEKVRLVLLDTGDYELLHGQKTPVSFAGVELTPGKEIVEYGANLAGLLREDAPLDPELQGWFPVQEYRQSLSPGDLDIRQGTQQRRPPARASLVRDVKQGEFSVLWQLLCREAGAALDENKRLRVILVGSLAGGFGSALVADLAYLARRAGEAQKAEGITVEAYLATNNAFSQSAIRPDVHAANTYAALRELERFQLAQGYPFRMIYNQEAAGNELLAGRIAGRLLDDIFLFDQAPNVTPVSEVQARRYHDPALGIFPAMADAITLWLDKASRVGRLSEYRSGVHQAMTIEQRAAGRIVVGGLGSYVYRLPMYDLIEQLKARWSRSVLSMLLVGPEGGEPRLDPNLNREYNPQRVTEHAHQFLIGLAGYGESPTMTRLAGMLAHEGLSPDFLEVLQTAEQEGAALQTYSRYLSTALLTILNGRVGSSIAGARSGKGGYALYFLENVFRALESAAQVLQVIPPDMWEETAGRLRELAALLPEMAEETRRMATSLRFQLGLISQRLRHESDKDNRPGLLERLERLEQARADILAEMDAVLVREYVRPPELLREWYETYLQDNDFSQEALQRVHWQMDEEGMLNLALSGSEVVLLGEDEDSQQAFLDMLLELANYATERIWAGETLASVLAKTALHRDNLDATLSRLQDNSQPLLGHQFQHADQVKMALVLGANAQVTDAVDLEDALRPALPNRDMLYSLFITDPYSLSLTQTVDVIPLGAIGSITAAEQVYRRWYGLLPQGTADPRAEPTAIFQAERIALMLEQQMQPELRQAARLLRPIVVTALDSGGVARLYALAYAAGWVRHTNDNVVALHVPNGAIIPLTKAGEPDANRPGRLFVLAFARFSALAANHLMAVNEALQQVENGGQVWAAWQEWTGRDWQQKPLAQQLLSGNDPDAADLATVVALVVRDELRRRAG